MGGGGWRLLKIVSDSVQARPVTLACPVLPWPFTLGSSSLDASHGSALTLVSQPEGLAEGNTDLRFQFHIKLVVALAYAQTPP